MAGQIPSRPGQRQSSIKNLFILHRYEYASNSRKAVILSGCAFGFRPRKTLQVGNLDILLLLLIF